ncbi:SigE family RNA polymerase sigma factor [Knoellia locipacati]|uniref:DNA-directed RNA polymerase sigma-70 factor n=1 Tax=Knoellia locipacati TaxID=882824 RepID=A0A512T1X9_9MICO|nr:SigE family RNA polymerase sigma factor [Knoellia locipacati]GEQ14164.1 DNA-directed RNA polymerase sigma-70 factor [Knoellia locipacati]
MSKRDDGSFDEFMRSSSPRLLRLAWLLTGGANSAEDLVQETLERVYVAWPRIEAGGTHNYARRVLVNLHTDSHRRRWRESLTSDVPETALADRTDQVVLADHLTAALAQLPVRERQCVVLRHHADLSEREVADTLNISTGTVKSSTSRGLARLRTLLVPEGDRHV